MNMKDAIKNCTMYQPFCSDNGIDYYVTTTGVLNIETHCIEYFVVYINDEDQIVLYDKVDKYMSTPYKTMEQELYELRHNETKEK
jgi:hypothetical protein